MEEEQTQARARMGGTCPADPLSSEEIATRRKITDGLARVAEQGAPAEQRREREQPAAATPAGRAPATADELRRCAHLRATHRCPGRCVFAGELRASGLDAFRAELDNSS